MDESPWKFKSSRPHIVLNQLITVITIHLLVIFGAIRRVEGRITTCFFIMTTDANVVHVTAFGPVIAFGHGIA